MTDGLSAAFQKLIAHLLIGDAIVDQNAHRVAADEETPALARSSVTREIERLNRHRENATAYSKLNDPENATGLNED